MIHTVNILDFRSTADGTDLTPAVQAAIAQARRFTTPVTITLPQGEYHFWPDKAPEKFYYVFNNGEGVRRMLFPLHGCQNLTIDGNGSSFIIHGRLSPFIVEDSQNITIRNLTIDCPRPFFTQGAVVEGTKEYVDLRIDPVGFPHRVENDALVACADAWESPITYAMLTPFDPRTRGPAYNAKYYCTAFRTEQRPAGIVRLHAAFDMPFRQGDVLTIGHEGRTNGAVVVTESRNVLVEDLDVFHIGGMGVMAQLSEDVTLRRVRVMPRPGSERIVSINADATHFVHCTGRVVLDHCVFEGMLDDATNVHGIYALIKSLPTPHGAEVELQRGDQLGYNLYRPGDRLTFSEPKTLALLHSAVVKTSRLTQPNLMLVEFNTPLPPAVVAGTAVNNPDRMPELTIRDCRTGNNRPRGFLLATPRKTVVERCVMYNSDCAINITADACDWFESGPVTDVTIRDNVFKDCGYAWPTCPISIWIHFTADRSTALPAYEHNIRIENNRFEHFSDQLLYALSVDGLTFKGNRRRRTTTYAPWNPNAAVVLQDCTNASIEDPVELAPL